MYSPKFSPSQSIHPKSNQSLSEALPGSVPATEGALCALRSARPPPLHISSSDGSSMMSLSGSSTYGASFSPVGSNGGGTAVPPVAAGGAAGSAVASQPLFHEATPATKPQMSSQICVRKG